MTSGRIGYLLFLIICLAGLAPWLAVQAHIALNTNHAWLAIAAGRFLDGGRMSVDFYETNPPLSILLYVPSVLMARILDIPLYYTPYIFGLICMILSALAVDSLLKAGFAYSVGKRIAVVAAFLAASTYLASNIYFAERDSFVVWGLLPFMLAQLTITRGVRCPRGLLLPVLALGAVAILIKPHYGLFPVLLLVHRMIKQKRFWSIVRDADFVALTIAVLLYAAVILLFFSDYLTVILPDMVGLYLKSDNPDTLITAIPYGALVVVCAVAAWFLVGKEERQPVLLAFLAAFIALCLFLLQMKGFFYHLAPAFVFFLIGLSLMITAMAGRFVRHEPGAGLLSAVLMMAIGWGVAPPQAGFLTHEEYRQTKLAGLVRGCASCNYFVFSENMEMIWQVSLYTGAVHASRFPCLWWLPVTLKTGDKSRKEKFGRMLAEDIERYQPEVMAIVNNLEIGGRPNFNLIAFFSDNEEFRKAMSRYRKTGELADNRRDYFRGSDLDYDFPLNYDIYRRVE